MPYLVRGEHDCPVYVCKTEKEKMDAIGRLIEAVPLSFLELIAYAAIIAGHEVFTTPNSIEIAGIRVERISEEEYEKWQRAFLPIS